LTVDIRTPPSEQSIRSFDHAQGKRQQITFNHFYGIADISRRVAVLGHQVIDKHVEPDQSDLMFVLSKEISVT